MRVWKILCALAVVLSLAHAVDAAEITIRTDATWKATSPQPPAGWNTSLSFDDSSWVNAFKSPTADHIWITSNMSNGAPDQAWFRKVFTLDDPVLSASVDLLFDDNGEFYLNGHLIVGDTGGGSTTFTGVNIDKSFFIAGENLLAIHGIDTSGPFNNVDAVVHITTATVPEPASLSIAAAGIALLMRRGRPARQ